VPFDRPSRDTTPPDPTASLARATPARLLRAAGVLLSALAAVWALTTPDHVLLFGFAALLLVLAPLAARTPRPALIHAATATLAASAVTLLATSAPATPAFLLAGVTGALAVGLHAASAGPAHMLTGAHVALFLALGLIRGAHPGVLVLHAAGVGVAGALAGALAAQLAAALHREEDRRRELAAARGALFAEVEVAQAVSEQEAQRSLELKAARDALAAEMQVAKEVQTLLLPRSPGMPGCEVVGHMLPAADVGGDYYDVLSCQGRHFVAVGDVAGHGLTSGLAMMMASTTLIGALEAAPRAPLPSLYEVLNRCVRRNFARIDLSIYMTFLLIEYLGEGRFVAVGRHLPLLVYRRARGEVEVIDVEGVWLGLTDELAAAQLGETHFELAPGDQLLLYTDGIVEKFADGEMFGFERLQALLTREGGRPPGEVIESMLQASAAFSEQQDDDMTLVVVERSPGERRVPRATAG
jgi:sigma-B regulation protein RsbU (phosphoserine phosphatase)